MYIALESIKIVKINKLERKNVKNFLRISLEILSNENKICIK